MDTFHPGDRVVAINTGPGPICGPTDPELHRYLTPDGLLQKDLVYHVVAVCPSRNGSQGLWITGVRVFQGLTEIPWSSSRFRKVDPLKGVTKASRRIRLVAAVSNGRGSIGLLENSGNS